MGMKRIHMGGIGISDGTDERKQLVIDGVSFPFRRKRSAKVFLHHGRCAGNQVAQVIGEIHIDGVDQQLVGEIAVRPEGEGSHEEEAERIHTELLGEHIRIHHIAFAFAHFSAVDNQPAVTVDLLRKGRIAGQIMEWKRTISLPTTCTSAGQYFSKSSYLSLR